MIQNYIFRCPIRKINTESPEVSSSYCKPFHYKNCSSWEKRMKPILAQYLGTDTFGDKQIKLIGCNEKIDVKTITPEFYFHKFMFACKEENIKCLQIEFIK